MYNIMMVYLPRYIYIHIYTSNEIEINFMFVDFENFKLTFTVISRIVKIRIMLYQSYLLLYYTRGLRRADMYNIKKKYI